MRPGLWQIVLVVVLIFILFGSNKIPDMMRNLAGGINVFKKELKDDKKEEKKSERKTVKKAAVKKSAVKKQSAVKSGSVKKNSKK